MLDKIDRIVSICSVVVVVGLMFVIEHYHDKVEYYEEALARSKVNALSESITLQGQIDKLKREHEDETRKKQSEIADLRKRIRDGDVRVSIAGSKPVSECTRINITETTTYLNARTADDLIGIAQRGDDAIRSLNACIDQYNVVRKKVNK